MTVTRRRLPKLYRKYEFTVQGNGIFPLDMLRYDSCYPVESTSVNNITDGSYFNPGIYDQGIYTVTLRSERAPTIGRWESFGWKVLDVKGVA